MDTEVLEAQLRQDEAQLQQAGSAVETANSQLAQRAGDVESRASWNPLAAGI